MVGFGVWDGEPRTDPRRGDSIGRAGRPALELLGFEQGRIHSETHLGRTGKLP